MPDAFARRVGPLPVWGWIVAALVVFLVWRRSTERGWFPTASFAVEGEPGTRLSTKVAAMLGGGGGVPAEEPAEVSAGGAFGALGRPGQPTSIIEGGADGSVTYQGGDYTGGGGSGSGYTVPVPVSPTGYVSPKTSPYGGGFGH